ncbi:MAG: hypothetical protein U0165_13510 [Polyangiaceae bacterium]
MAKNRVFFPQEALDLWLVEEKIELGNDQLTLLSEGRKFRITEAARVLAEVTGTPDSFELVGKVKSKNYLHELGAEVLDQSMIIGDNAYDIVPGFLGTPMGSFAEHRASYTDLSRVPTTDEELLGQFLLRVL